MVMVVHVDRNPDNKELATQAFELLTQLKHQADAKIDRGTYGITAAPEPPKKPAFVPIEISSKLRKYVVLNKIGQNDISNLFVCTYDTDRIDLLKIVRSPKDNDLMLNEVKVVESLWASKGRKYVSEVVDSFVVTDETKVRRQATVSRLYPNTHSMEDIIAAYPKGVDPRDAAWMFNRILEGLYFFSGSHRVHAAILPPNLLVNTEEHGIIFSEWSYSVDTSKGETVKAISSKHEAWYAPEILKKMPVSSATDIYMAAECIVKVMGGDPISGKMPDVVPRQLQGFIRACMLGTPSKRPQNAGDLREELGGLLKELYGKPKFRHFTMPTKA